MISVENRKFSHPVYLIHLQFGISTRDQTAILNLRKLAFWSHDRYLHGNFRKFRMVDGRHFEKKALSPYLSCEWSDFDQIWFADANFLSRMDIWKKSKFFIFKMADGRHIENHFFHWNQLLEAIITNRPTFLSTVRSLWFLRRFLTISCTKWGFFKSILGYKPSGPPKWCKLTKFEKMQTVCFVS